jgi:hypothetical protein
MTTAREAYERAVKRNENGFFPTRVIETAAAYIEELEAPRTITVWTLSENYDGDESVRVYTDELKLRRDVWADVKEAADGEHDLETGLGTDEFGGELDVNEIGDWCRFIETHGWKCRAYTIETQQIEVSA